MVSLPKDYVNRMKEMLGDEYADYEAALQLRAVKGFRVNTAKISLEDFERVNVFSKEKIPFTENGFYLDYEKIGNHPFHHAGMIYVQEPAAMVPAESIEINPDWKILDMCSAPGGKSTQLKMKLGEDGLLVSNEIVPSRCKILTGNIERMGFKNTVTTCMDSKRLAETFPKFFDMVMVDAPCSGEGMFRKEENAVSEWSLENVRLCAARQSEILENAAAALGEGGYIVYATCTFSLEENEKLIDSFLKKHTDFELVPVTERVKQITADGICFSGCQTENIKECRRCYPHKMRGEGQFVAVLHNKNPKTNEFAQREKNTVKIEKIVTDFLEDVLDNFDANEVKMNGNTPIIFSFEPLPQKATVFSCGITIGEIKKGYILPHHQFFMGMGKCFRRKIELSADDERLNRYLRGEEISVDCENGWAAVLVNGCAVGGAKVVSGTAKNHYPKGLRIK